MLNSESMADLAKQGAEIACVYDELIPVIFLDVEDNVEIVGITTPNLGNPEMEKTLQIEGVTQLLRDKDITQYAHVYEGWATTFAESAQRMYEQGKQIRDLPPEDRNDMAIVMVVRKGEGVVLSYTGIIDTKSDGKRKLREWQKTDGMEGRMVITDW